MKALNQGQSGRILMDHCLNLHHDPFFTVFYWASPPIHTAAF